MRSTFRFVAHCCFYFLGLNEKSKGNDAFIDVLPGTNRLDKIRQEKLKRFRESIGNKLGNHENDDGIPDDNRTWFNVPWRDNGEFDPNESDYQRYLRNLNAIIFLKVKSSTERQLNQSILNSLKAQELSLYQEVLAHLNHYATLASRTCLGFDSFIENNASIRQWLSTAQTNEHYPLMIVGSRASGKTLLCTKLVQYLATSLGKTGQCIVRYFNFTGKSRHIIELFSSICTQMNALQDIPLKHNEQAFNSIEFYQSVLIRLSESQKPIIIMIDGLEDTSAPNQHRSSMIYYSTLLKKIPANVSVDFFLRSNSIDLVL